MVMGDDDGDDGDCDDGDCDEGGGGGEDDDSKRVNTWTFEHKAGGSYYT